MLTTSSRSNVNVGPEVFINFRGKELRSSFVSHLHKALVGNGIKAFIDSDMVLGDKLITLFKTIEESKIALAILSSKYTESRWCLDELVKIKECGTKGEGSKNLVVIPIFYKIDRSVVENLEGDFGVNLWNVWRKPGGVRDNRIVKWNAALQDMLSRTALIYDESIQENAFVAKIVTEVKNALDLIWLQSQENPKRQERGVEEIPIHPKCNSRASSSDEPGQCLKQLEEKLDMDSLDCSDDRTRVLGIVGMAGIGKTYLADKLLDKLKTKIGRDLIIKFGCDNEKEQESDWLEKTLVEGLLKKDYPSLRFADGNSLEHWKNRLIVKKVVVLFDNVSDKKHLEPFMGNCKWIKKGSRIVITTRDRSLTEGLTVCDLYEVPGLTEREGLELFRAKSCTTLEGNFMELSRKLVGFTGGNPLALEAFGEELLGKDEEHWEARLRTLTQVSNKKIGKVLRTCFDGLSEKQKDAFLDIAIFFRSKDENYLRSLLDSFDPDTPEAKKEFRELVDKFLISISDGRVEMNDLLCTMAMELVETSGGKYLLLPSHFAGSNTDALKNKEGNDKVRGVILDMSNMEEKPLDNQAFESMSSLLYLKVYYSLCSMHSKAGCKLNLPDGIYFSKDNILRYLDWMRFPGKELPSDFEPTNLIDLRLPYSKIKCVWECAKVAPKLKWVDLSHSSELTSISSLSDAPNLLKLNLEGCTSLKELPEEMQKMKKLVFLNLRGCTSLLSLPNINMDSLKTLILSGCSKLQAFEVISKSLETLYLNGTAIEGLPPAIGNLHSLNFLNLKDCANLATLPDCLGKLKSLQELKLSRCSKLEVFPEVKEIMESLRVLLLDGTSITEMPSSVIYLSSLRRLCLSRNDKISSLQFDMGHMSHLKWLELKYCTNLTSLPRLPPNLQCLNAHGCTSLRTVASPLDLLMSTEQIHSIYIFTNCHELEQGSKNDIISYVQKKSELMSDDRYNKDFVFKALISTCFPGCDIPAWFDHQVLGSVLKMELPKDLNTGRFIGIALAVVVSFKEYRHQNNSTLQVKCTCEFTNASSSPEIFIVGGWSEPGGEPHTVESDHVFIGYTTWFNIKKRQQISSVNEVSLRFEVINGTSAVAECEVMRSGFSLVNGTEEAENISWEATSRLEKRSSYTEDDYPSGTPTKPDFKREEKAFVTKIVTKVQDALTQILWQSQENPKSQERGVEEIPKPLKYNNRASSSVKPGEKRLKQLEEKLDVDCNEDETRILGIVGMAGIGKTYLAKKLFVKLEMKLGRALIIEFDCENSNWLEKGLVEGLLKKDDPSLIFADGNSLEDWKDLLNKKKVVVVLDNVSDKKHLEPFIGNCDWIKKGSRIVITTRDKSLTDGLTVTCDLYEVPRLNEREGLELFRTTIGTTLEGNFMELSRKFVGFTGGNPLALEAFGEELRGKDEDHWEARLRTLTQVSNEKIGKVLRTCFDGPNQKQKDAFLDIAIFFRSQDEKYVRSLLESFDPDTSTAGKEFRELIDKFLIGVSDGRVEMNDLLLTMAVELVETSGGKYLLLPSHFAGSNTDSLKNIEGKEGVRGIILDMCNMEEKPLDNQAFESMSSLLYLKVYYSLCSMHTKAGCKLNLPDGIYFSKDNILRYLEWMRFPGKELPSDFEPTNLIDLRLPYSKIKCVWECAKVAPKLKWVDLSHSSELTSISSLSDVPNLLKLNLEGCTSLKELPEEMQKMKKLVFLNLRGCTSLLSLPNINMDSLKTLILSGCSKLQAFEVISKSLETLYLNGTAIDGLPPAIGNLHSLNFLNLKDCANLATLPDCLGKLKSLQELKLSRCSKLEVFPEVKEIMESLRVLLLDGTSITEMPSSVIDLSSLRRLCLSGNDKISSLQFDMDNMSHLKWLELKYCTNLTSLPRLPPNLQCLNAHGCTSLRTVASPLDLLMSTEQIHSTFIFTNCHELEQGSKNDIISYIQKKSELMSDDRYNQDFVFKALISTCFPGCDIPAWFNHQALGSVLKMELPKDCNTCRFFGIALAVVVSFKEYRHQNNSTLQVKCTCEFTNSSLSPESFVVGGWSEPGDEPHTVESDHVFIGYTTWFNIKKRQQLSSANEVSLRFEVTNGTSAAAECEVVKSGFSLVYETEEAENASWEATSRLEKRSSYTEDDYPSDTPSPTTYASKRYFSFLRRAQ